MKVMQEGESFELLKYLLFLEKLDDDEKHFLKKTVRSIVPMSNVPCRAHYNFPGVQQVKVTLDSSCKLGSLDYFGIGTKADGSDMKLYSKHNNEL